MLLVGLYVIQLAVGANKARGSRTWSSPGHLSLIAFSCYAAGGQAGEWAGPRGRVERSVTRRITPQVWNEHLCHCASLDKK